MASVNYSHEATVRQAKLWSPKVPNRNQVSQNYFVPFSEVT
jgi:hypothetical protein